jgi:Family of unknown function (DUF6152)
MVMSQGVQRTGFIIAAFIIWLSQSALAHHSFAMYDMTKSQSMTGKLTRFIPGGNHAQLKKDGKVVVWGVETGSAATIARNGITVESFPVGTVIGVTLHPLRDGRPFGAVGGPIIHCGTTMPAGGCTEKTGKAFGAPAN